MNKPPAKTFRHQAFFWFSALIGITAFLYLFKSILAPFVIGAALAYLLNPLVTHLGKLKIGRKPASFMILGGFLILVLTLLALVSPLLYKQSLQLAQDLPSYIEKLVTGLEPLSQKFLALTGQNPETTDLKTLLQAHSGALFSTAQSAALPVLGSLAAGGQAALNLLSFIVFMPIVAYFLMQEWPHIIKWGEDILPRDHKDTVTDLIEQIDRKLSGFVRGQITVAVFLGLAYAVALSIAGLKYGALIGLSAGALSIIPMLGSTLGLLVSVGVAWFQSGEITFTAIIAGIFIAGQLIEGNILTPKLVGDSVGLHPLWVFFALLAGGALMGITGMFLAVPVAAIAGVLIAFAIKRYKDSAYFKGTSKDDEDNEQQG